MTRARLARRPASGARPLPNTESAPIPFEALSEPSPAELALADERAEAAKALAGRHEGRSTPVVPLKPVERTGAGENGRDVLTLSEAARYARRTKPNGTPRDSFYSAIKRELGLRKRVYRDEIDDLS